MEREKFEKLVEEALASLPRRFRKLLHNLAVIVEDNPPRDMSSRRTSSSNLLGLYHGVPFNHRGSYYGNVPPDVIFIYQKPIEQISSSDDEIKKRVREVVLHEIGHYFGLSEEELRQIENRLR